VADKGVLTKGVFYTPWMS